MARLAHGVINLDDPFGVALAARLEGRVNRIGYCLERAGAKPRRRASRYPAGRAHISVGPGGVAFDIDGAGAQGVRIASPVLGRFNVSNLLAVAATAGCFRL